MIEIISIEDKILSEIKRFHDTFLCVELAISLVSLLKYGVAESVLTEQIKIRNVQLNYKKYQLIQDIKKGIQYYNEPQHQLQISKTEFDNLQQFLDQLDDI